MRITGIGYGNSFHSCTEAPDLAITGGGRLWESPSGLDHRPGHNRRHSLQRTIKKSITHHFSYKSEAQKGLIQRQIDATDREIDSLVYKLYSLTEKEIKIVEGER